MKKSIKRLSIAAVIAVVIGSVIAAFEPSVIFGVSMISFTANNLEWF